MGYYFDPINMEMVWDGVNEVSAPEEAVSPLTSILSNIAPTISVPGTGYFDNESGQVVGADQVANPVYERLSALPKMDGVQYQGGVVNTPQGTQINGAGNLVGPSGEQYYGFSAGNAPLQFNFSSDGQLRSGSTQGDATYFDANPVGTWTSPSGETFIVTDPAYSNYQTFAPLRDPESELNPISAALWNPYSGGGLGNLFLSGLGAYNAAAGLGGTFGEGLATMAGGDVSGGLSQIGSQIADIPGKIADRLASIPDQIQNLPTTLSSAFDSVADFANRPFADGLPGADATAPQFNYSASDVGGGSLGYDVATIPDDASTGGDIVDEISRMGWNPQEYAQNLGYDSTNDYLRNKNPGWFDPIGSGIASAANASAQTSPTEQGSVNATNNTATFSDPSSLGDPGYRQMGTGFDDPATDVAGNPVKAPSGFMGGDVYGSPLSIASSVLSGDLPTSALTGGDVSSGMGSAITPMQVALGAGAATLAANAIGASNAAERAAEAKRIADERAAANRAAYDNPPLAPGATPPGAKMSRAYTPYSGAMTRYGQGAEHRFFGSPEFHAAGGRPGTGSRRRGPLSLIAGSAGGQDDVVPALLAPTEYVLDADVVASIGDGNPEEGARKLDAFRENVRKHKRSAPANKIPPKAKPVAAYMGK